MRLLMNNSKEPNFLEQYFEELFDCWKVVGDVCQQMEFDT